MRVAIDITPLQTGHKDRGVGAYTRSLIEALEKYEGNHSYHFFVRGQKVPNSIELIHYPYFDPSFVTLPLFYSKPTVITVHDLIPLVFPRHFLAGTRGLATWQYQRLRLSRVRRVIADSECSKRDIVRIVGVPPSRIDAIHLAPAREFRPVTDKQKLQRVKKKYHLPDRFILYVGDVNWNKNILGLLEAMHGLHMHVALVGKAFLDSSLDEMRQINALIEKNNLVDTVVRLGGVPMEDLVIMYSLASVYIQPSFYEGFGLPVLEAMACGVPVVTSREASLSEIAGPAVTVDPHRPEEIARGLVQALTLPAAKRAALIRAQSEWVQKFSWRRVARETIMSYEKALG